ncbi:unnamed protein product [Amoebophrya sp. A25]|nr:unnamed protein product [Amoebophrya sp. A25]|eukprot:GSA25T00026218001.1
MCFATFCHGVDRLTTNGKSSASSVAKFFESCTTTTGSSTGGGEAASSGGRTGLMSKAQWIAEVKSLTGDGFNVPALTKLFERLQLPQDALALKKQATSGATPFLEGTKPAQRAAEALDPYSGNIEAYMDLCRMSVVAAQEESQKAGDGADAASGNKKQMPPVVVDIASVVSTTPAAAASAPTAGKEVAMPSEVSSEATKGLDPPFVHTATLRLWRVASARHGNFIQRTSLLRFLKDLLFTRKEVGQSTTAALEQGAALAAAADAKGESGLVSSDAKNAEAPSSSSSVHVAPRNSKTDKTNNTAAVATPSPPQRQQQPPAQQVPRGLWFEPLFLIMMQMRLPLTREQARALFAHYAREHAEQRDTSQKRRATAMEDTSDVGTRRASTFSRAGAENGAEADPTATASADDSRQESLFLSRSRAQSLFSDVIDFGVHREAFFYFLHFHRIQLPDSAILALWDQIILPKWRGALQNSTVELPSYMAETFIGQWITGLRMRNEEYNITNPSTTKVVVVYLGVLVAEVDSHSAEEVVKISRCCRTRTLTLT